MAVPNFNWLNCVIYKNYVLAVEPMSENPYRVTHIPRGTHAVEPMPWNPCTRRTPAVEPIFPVEPMGHTGILATDVSVKRKFKTITERKR